MTEGETAINKFPYGYSVLIDWTLKDKWARDTAEKLQKLLEIVKNRDRWDKELSAKTNYRLLQDRFETIEKIIEKLLEALK